MESVPNFIVSFLGFTPVQTGRILWGETGETGDRRDVFSDNGTDEFVKELEAELERRLAPAPGGGPRKQPTDGRQSEFGFSQS